MSESASWPVDFSEGLNSIYEKRRQQEDEWLEEFYKDAEKGGNACSQVLKIAQAISPSRLAKKPLQEQTKAAQYEIVRQAAQMLDTYKEVKKILQG